jgi:TetR/AcrR family transcriptional regulator
LNLKKIPLKRRAVKDAAKHRKRETIIEIAATMLSKRAFESVSMDEVAKVAGIAKGTLYLYFETREELFLAVYVHDFNDWYATLNAFLHANEKISAEKFAAWFADNLRGMPRFRKLAVAVPTVFERNIPKEAAVNFKRLATAQLTATAPILAERVGFKSEAQAIRFLIQLMGLIVGLWSLGYDSPLILEIVHEEKLEHFPADFYEFLGETTQQLLRGTLGG